MMVDLIDAKFYALMGKAVSRWAAIDRQVFEIFRIALGTDERRALVCYQTKSGVGSRMGLAASIIAAIEPELATRFRGIQREAGKLLEGRNLMAHGRPALNMMEAVIGTEGTATMEDYVQIFHPLPVGASQVRMKRYEIVEHIGAVGDLEARLETFTRELWVVVDRRKREQKAAEAAAATAEAGSVPLLMETGVTAAVPDPSR